ACAPPARGGGSCFQLFPSRPTLLKLHAPQLLGCVPRGRSLVYSGTTRARQVALTFDDGPWNDPPASQFLDVLAREHVVATCFELGRQISGYDPGWVLERVL